MVLVVPEQFQSAGAAGEDVPGDGSAMQSFHSCAAGFSAVLRPSSGVKAEKLDTKN